MAQTTPKEIAAKNLIARRLCDGMARRKITQTALGAAVERGQGVISDWRSGQRRLNYSDAWRVAEILGIPIDALIGPPRTEVERRQYDADVVAATRRPHHAS